MGTAETHWLGIKDESVPRVLFGRVWLLAFVAYGVGDVLTTLAIYYSPLHVEANPIVAATIGAFGSGGVFALKLFVFAVCIGVSLWYGANDDDLVFQYGPPLVLAGLGTVATVHNLTLLL